MPYEVRKNHKKYCVFNTVTNDNKGCSPTRAKALAHMRALYAVESGKSYSIETLGEALFHLNLAADIQNKVDFSQDDEEELSMHLDEAIAALDEFDSTDDSDEEFDVINADAGMKELPWEGPIVYESVLTGDNRIFKPGSINWEADTLPWAFRWQKHSGQGHAGSVPVGRVDSIQRMEDGSIWGKGVVIPALSDESAEYVKLLQSGVGGGVSVDGDSAQFDIIEMADGPPRVEFSSMRLRALSGVDIPAFNEAKIHLVDSNKSDVTQMQTVDDVDEILEMLEVLESIDTVEIEIETDEFAKKKKKKHASYGWKFDGLVAAAIPVLPSTEAFIEPEFDGPTPLTVTKDGKVFGHLALFNTCHIGFPGTCVKPPKGSKYQYFHTGEIETAEGDLVAVGHLTFNTGHAAMQANPRAAAEHYDNTGTVAADVRAGEDQFGIWVVGALRSHLSDEDIRAFRSAPLSGDWRRIAGKLELVGALAVNVPGFPIPRAKALVASGETETLFTFLEDDDEEFFSDYELKLRVNKKAALANRIAPSKTEVQPEITIEGSDPISDYELQLRYNKKLALAQQIVGQDTEFAQSLEDFIAEKDNNEEVPSGDNLPQELPDLPKAPTKKDFLAIAKNYTQAELLHDLQDLRDLLDDPAEKIGAKDRKGLEALYDLFITTNSSGQKVSATGENIEEFYNHCHGKGGKFCPTGGRSGGGGGVSGKAGGPPRNNNNRPPFNKNQKPGQGFDKNSHDREQAVKQLQSYRTSKVSARRWATTGVIATVAELAIKGGLPLIKLVGPISPLLASPAFLVGLGGLGAYHAGAKLIAARNHKRDFSSTIDRINKRQKIDEQIRRLNSTKP